MLKVVSMFAALLASPSLANADDLDPLIGTWISPDCNARQSISRSFDDSLIETRMWFQSDSGWRLVASGAMYRRPGDRVWRSVSRTRDMDDIELFESTIIRTTDVAFDTANIAYQSDGSTIKTEEEWVLTGDNRFHYRIYKIEDGARVPWMKGEWVRTQEAGQCAL